MAASVSSVTDGLALMESDKENIRLLWKRLSDNAEENGRLILIKFFTDYPESKRYFKTVPTEGDLYENIEVARHGARVINTFNTVIGSMEDWQNACKLLKRLVDRHKNVHKVPPVMFQRLFQAFLVICHNIMGDELTNDMLVSWDKFFQAVYEEILVAYGRKRLL